MVGKSKPVKLVRFAATPDKLREIEQSVDWDRVRALSDDEVAAGIDEDPDASPITVAQGMALRLQLLRKRLGLSQPQFAHRYHIPLGTLRDWEQARRQPDRAAWAYILVIQHRPDVVSEALEGANG